MHVKQVSPETRRGLPASQAGTRLFCTGESEAGDVFVGVYAEAVAFGVTLPLRHWYRINVVHKTFDRSDLTGGVGREGCLAYGQWRVYRIQTHGAYDAALDVVIDTPVQAMYVRQDLPPTELEYDAIAAWPLRRSALTSCAVGLPTNW